MSNDQTPIMTMRFKFKRTASLRFLSHLDQQSAFQRAFRRAKIPFAYSNGFHAHPKLSFALALSVGMTSSSEYADLRLTEEVNPSEFVSAVNASLPDGLKILDAKLIKGKVDSLSASIKSSSYRIKILDHKYDKLLSEEIQNYLNQNEILVEKRNKKGRLQMIDARPFIKQFSVVQDDHDDLQFNLSLNYQDQKTIKPTIILRSFETFAHREFGDDLLWQVHRENLELSSK